MRLQRTTSRSTMRAVVLTITAGVFLAYANVARAGITFSIGPVDPIIVPSSDQDRYTARVSGFASSTGSADLDISCASTLTKASVTVPSGATWRVDVDVPFGSSTVSCTAADARTAVVDEPVTVSIDVLVAIRRPLTVWRTPPARDGRLYTELAGSRRH